MESPYYYLDKVEKIKSNHYLRAYAFVAKGIQIQRKNKGFARGKGITKKLLSSVISQTTYLNWTDTDRAFIDAMLDSVN